MLSKGLNVPVCWEHRSDAAPKRLSEDDRKSLKALGTAGHVEQYELDSGSRVFATVDLPDEADAKQAAKVRFCSPEINRFTDGDGHDWGEVITHVALTPRPRQYDQPPIARLSLTGPIRLAFDPEKGNDMADEKDEGSKKKKGDESETPEPKAADEKIKPLIDALREVGMTIPDEVVDIDGLVIAIKAGGAKEEEVDDLDTGDDDALPDNIGPTTQSPPIGLSHDATEAEKKSLAKAEKAERKGLVRRIARCLDTGRVSPPIAKNLNAQLEQIRLSFSDDGELATNNVLVQIEAYEALPPKHTWAKKGKRKQLSHADVSAVDSPHKGDKSSEETLSDWDKT